jgi:hypothetical protein
MEPILDVFLEKFLDSYGLEIPSAWQPMYWIQVGRPYQLWRLGAAARTFSPLLCDTFAAISTTSFGLSIGDGRLVSAGDKVYFSNLRSLQTAICHPKQSKSDEVLMAATLCGVYEVRASANIASASLSFLLLGPEVHGRTSLYHSYTRCNEASGVSRGPKSDFWHWTWLIC